MPSTSIIHSFIHSFSFVLTLNSDHSFSPLRYPLPPGLLIFSAFLMIVQSCFFHESHAIFSLQSLGIQLWKTSLLKNIGAVLASWIELAYFELKLLLLFLVWQVNTSWYICDSIFLITCFLVFHWESSSFHFPSGSRSDNGKTTNRDCHCGFESPWNLDLSRNMNNWIYENCNNLFLLAN